MATRRQVRQSVISLLYAHEFNTINTEFITEFLELKKIRNEQKTFALALYEGVRTNLTAINEKLAPFIKEAQKVSKVEMAILRLSAFEFCFTDTDKAVIINEAIELGKELANENSPKFINAVLDTMKKELR